jgi:hypothetical protein
VSSSVHLVADLNAQDDEGLGWTTLDDAREPDVVRPGAYLLAGNRHGQAVVRIVTVGDDGQIHISILPSSVAKNRHLLGRTVPDHGRPAASATAGRPAARRRRSASGPSRGSAA